jgi:sulfonate transport system substrate-binding protein
MHPRRYRPQAGWLLRSAVVLGLAFALLMGVSTAAATTSRSSQNLTTLRIGVPTTIVTGAPYLADKWGYLRKEGIKPEFIVATTGQLLTQAMLAGDVDVATSSFIIPMQLAEQGQQLRLLSNTCDKQSLAILVPKSSSLQRIGDLAGKKVGVAALGSAQQTTFGVLLQQNGLQSNSVTYVPVGTGPTAVAAFRRGIIDALFTSDPGIQILRLSGEARIISDLRRGQGGAVANVPSVGTFTTLKFIQENTAVAHAYTRALTRTLKRMKAQPRQAANVFLSLPQYKTAGGARVVRSAVLGDVPCFTPYITRAQINAASSVFTAAGVLKQPHTYEQTVAVRFAKEWNVNWK